MNLTIREATLLDGNLLFSWANDLVMRTMAVHSSYINYADHFRWFQRALKNSDCTIYIVFLSGRPVGQARFDFIGCDAEIDVYLAPEYRGVGLATPMLSLCIGQVYSHLQGVRLNASVLLGNYPSYFLFYKSFFSFVEYSINNKKVVMRLHRLARI